MIIHSSASRSQLQNKQMAFTQLVNEVSKALYVPKKRMKTHIPVGAKETRLKSKAVRSTVKKLRSKKHQDDW
jgi:ribosome-associated protein